jgi:hypothetical protein
MGFKLYPRKVVSKTPFWRQPPPSSSDHEFPHYPIRDYDLVPRLSSITIKNQQDMNVSEIEPAP